MKKKTSLLIRPEFLLEVHRWRSVVGMTLSAFTSLSLCFFVARMAQQGLLPKREQNLARLEAEFQKIMKDAREGL